MKARKFLGVLLILMTIACWPGNVLAAVTQMVTAGFNEGQYQHVTVNEDVVVSDETNAVFVEAHAPEDAEDKTASAIVNGSVTLTHDSDISVVYAEGRNGDASAEISGNISGTSSRDVNGIETWGHAYNGDGDVYITAGSGVLAESSLSNACGIESYHAGVNVSGDVTAKGNETAYGVNSCYDNNLTVGGNVTSEGKIPTGIYAYSGKKTLIDVKGRVDSTGCYAKGLQIETSSGGDLSLAVGGAIQAAMNETDPEEWYGAYGIAFYNNGGKLAADINGDVEAKAANGRAIGIRTDHSGDETGHAFGDGASEIFVHGNVISDGIGVALDTFGENTNVDVLVENEIRANGVGVSIGRTWFAEESSETEPRLTVWKIGLNDSGKAVDWIDSGFDDTWDDEYKAKAVADFEKHIMYIARAEQPSDGGTIKAVAADGSDLSKSYDLPVAHEGDKVVLKADLEPGWKIKAAYNGRGDNIQQLSRDANGDYYVIVPKGGGIYLSVDLEQETAIPKGKTLTYNGKAQTGVAAGEGYTLSGKASAANAGSYQATAALKEGYVWTDGTTAPKTIKWKINKAANPLKCKGRNAKVKYIKLKKSAQKLKAARVIKFIRKGRGNMNYSIASAKKGGKDFRKKFAINKKNGKVTVKKGLKKGKYIVRIKVKAAGNANYKKSTVKTVKATIRVL